MNLVNQGRRARMIIIVRESASAREIDLIMRRLEQKGYNVQVRNGKGQNPIVAAFALFLARKISPAQVRKWRDVEGCVEDNGLFLDTNGEGFFESGDFRFRNGLHHSRPKRQKRLP